MLQLQGVSLQLGDRLLLDRVDLRLAPRERVALVGRNGAGKTTLTKILAGEGQPTAGKAVQKGSLGYLPQDPRTGDLEQIAMDRILSVRDLAGLMRKMREAEEGAGD